METAKRNNLIWIAAIALAFILVFFAGWWMKPPKIIDTPGTYDSLMDAHRRDSVAYAIKLAMYDSISTVLSVAIVGKNRQIIILQKALEQKSEEIKRLPATESAALFAAEINDTAYLQIDRDTMCVTTIPGIRRANLLFNERRHYLNLSKILSDKNELQSDMITWKSEELSVVKDRVIQVTGEYYKVNDLYLKQRNQLVKANKKVKNRNIAIGIISGIAVGGIVTALIVN
jgi:hypothetical protein